MGRTKRIDTPALLSTPGISEEHPHACLLHSRVHQKGSHERHTLCRRAETCLTWSSIVIQTMSLHSGLEHRLPPRPVSQTLSYRCQSRILDRKKTEPYPPRNSFHPSRSPSQESRTIAYRRRQDLAPDSETHIGWWPDNYRQRCSPSPTSHRQYNS